MRCSTVLKRLAVTATVLLAVSVLAAAATPAEVKKAEKAPKGPKPDVVFDGKDRELKQWQTKGKKSYWVVGSAKLDSANPRELVVSKEGKELVNAKGHGVDIYSKYVHGDAIIKLEVMVPKGSNSGIYVHGEYEIQVLDSFGRDKNPGKGDMGAIYGAAPPKKPKYKEPGEWSTYEIHFLAPRFDADGKKTANAKFVKMVLNGQVIHENVEMKGPTPGGVDRKEKPEGPIMFQGNHGPVAYRNITVLPLKR
ncbi:MAG: DUF1080 domain-containing protein [Phycisphaerae bacterium]